VQVPLGKKGWKIFELDKLSYASVIIAKIPKSVYIFNGFLLKQVPLYVSKNIYGPPIIGLC
jgi:hypothetical protein